MNAPGHFRPRILFVTPNTPFSTASGSEQRSALMLEGLSQAGTVDVLQLNPGKLTQVERADVGATVRVMAFLSGADKTPFRYRPKPAFTRLLEAALGRRMDEYQLIVGRYLWPTCQLQIPHHVPLVADLDDFRYRYSPLLRWSSKNAGHRLSKALVHALARRQIKRLSGAFVVSAQDQREVRALQELPAAYLPNVPVSGAASTPETTTSKTLLFVGSLWYQPNVDGVEWFLEHVWPQVLTSSPDANLMLVGAASEQARKGWMAHPRVNAPGFVDDIQALYREAAVVIVPVLSGGGSNIKVLEALGRCKPCVVSRFVANAFVDSFEDGKHFLVADSAEAFSQKASQVLHAEDPTRWQEMAQAGCDVVSESFTPEIFCSRVVAFAETMMSASKP